MYKENAALIIKALIQLEDVAIRTPDVLMMGVCTEVNILLEPLAVTWARDEVRRSWEDTRNEAFACWQQYSGDAVYPVVDRGDRTEFEQVKSKGYYGTLPYFQYNYRALWSGRQLELRLDLIEHCIKFYEALRDS